MSIPPDDAIKFTHVHAGRWVTWGFARIPLEQRSATRARRLWVRKWQVKTWVLAGRYAAMASLGRHPSNCTCCDWTMYNPDGTIMASNQVVQ